MITSSTGGKANATDRDKAVEFAECMRDNGVGEFPDPDASGELIGRDCVSFAGQVVQEGVPQGRFRVSLLQCRACAPAGRKARDQRAAGQLHEA